MINYLLTFLLPLVRKRDGIHITSTAEGSAVNLSCHIKNIKLADVLDDFRRRGVENFSSGPVDHHGYVNLHINLMSL